ncbi:MAG: sigma-70 family RNA polymerase sigma factor [Polyangiaceae bacterium]
MTERRTPLPEDTASFVGTLRASTPRLFRVALRLLGRRAEAEDAVQEGALKAFDAIASGRYDDRLAMESWLVAIVSRVAIDMLRRRKVRGEADAAIDPESVRWDTATDDQVGAAIEIGRWLAALPIDQRAAVVLKYFEGMTSREAAEVLGVSEGAVEQRLLRARAKLMGKDRDDDAG